MTPDRDSIDLATKDRETNAPEVEERSDRPAGPESGGRDSGLGISWLAMLAWILVAFLVAGLIAYRLVRPFFHRG